jgi:DNA-binding MarR family transcriptional regulator
MSASKLRIYHRLQIAAHAIKKSADRQLLAAAGVTTAQAAVLAVAAHNGGATQRSVAEKLELNESAMSAMVARLMKAGLLARKRDARDPRAWRLTVTTAGRATLGRVRPAFARINAGIEAALSQPALADLATALERIAATFGNAEAER